MVAQIVQLLWDGTSIHAVTRRFPVSLSTVSRAGMRYQETGRYTELDRAMDAGPVSSPLCEQMRIGGALPEPCKRPDLICDANGAPMAAL